MLFCAKAALEQAGIIIPEKYNELVEFLRTAKDALKHLVLLVIFLYIANMCPFVYKYYQTYMWYNGPHCGTNI